MRRLVGLLLVLTAMPVQAQAPEPSSPRREGKLDLALVATGGNTNTQSIGAAGETTFRPEGWVFALRGGFLRSKSEGVVNAASTRALVRVSRRIGPNLELFGQHGYLRDRFSGVVRRHTTDAGLSHRLLRTSRHELSAEGTVGFLNEARTIDGSLSTGQASTGTLYAFKFSETSRVTDELQVAVDLHADGTWRINHVVAATAQLNALIALKLSNVLRFVHEPVPGFERTDTVASASVVVTF